VVNQCYILFTPFVKDATHPEQEVVNQCYILFTPFVKDATHPGIPIIKHNRIWCSPNQAKWATSSPWFQWSCPISVKKRSFSCPVSLFKSVFFSPIIILFLQYSHNISCSWNVTGFDVQYFIPNSLIASF
jgi:hypothetical protein